MPRSAIHHSERNRKEKTAMRKLMSKRISSLFVALLLCAVSLVSGARTNAQDREAAKRAGLVRICLAVPKAQMGVANNAEAIAAVRESFAEYLKGPTLEVAALTARLPSQAMEEARLSHCDYVLFTSLVHKKSSGNSLFRKAMGDVASGGAADVSTAVSRIPTGSTSGSGVGSATSAGFAKAASETAVTGARRTADLAATMGTKDELKLEYVLKATDGRTLLAKSEKVNARLDREDLLTPLVEKAGEAIAAAVTKR